MPLAILIGFALMASAPSCPFTLCAHPLATSDAVRRITGRVARLSRGTLMITYTLEGDLDRVRVPARKPPRFADELWRHTCCEMFIKRQDAAAYHEFNFSPSGEWAVYRFAGTRQRVTLDAGVAVEQLDPKITVCRSEAKVELDAVVHLERIAPADVDAKLKLGLATVVEDHTGHLSYWALHHPADRPDFHHPHAFALELDEVRH